MKAILAAAALAAAVPAVASAVPPSTSGGPLGSNACTVFGGTPADATCRFVGSSSGVGDGGFAGPGATITLSHNVTTASCVNHVIVLTTTKVVDDSASGPGYLGSQGGFLNGIVYTLHIDGPGWAIAGGPSSGAPSGAPSEPADNSVDQTGGKTAGAAC